MTDKATKRTESPASTPFRVGAVLQGYCNGHFGRDEYGAKRIEATGADWIVVRYVESGRPDFAQFDSSAEMDAFAYQWLHEDCT